MAFSVIKHKDFFAFTCVYVAGCDARNLTDRFTVYFSVSPFEVLGYVMWTDMIVSNKFVRACREHIVDNFNMAKFFFSVGGRRDYMLTSVGLLGLRLRALSLRNAKNGDVLFHASLPCTVRYCAPHLCMLPILWYWGQLPTSVSGK
jgi:hypothetical protein